MSCFDVMNSKQRSLSPGYSRSHLGYDFVSFNKLVATTSLLAYVVLMSVVFVRCTRCCNTKFTMLSKKDSAVVVHVIFNSL